MLSVIQILFEIIILAVLIIVLKKKLKISFDTVIVGSSLLISAFFASNMVLEFIPSATEQITLTATGEKNKDAFSNAVVLSEIIVDGEHFAVNDIEKGKWFWQGDKYFMWRNENDIRPDGITESVTLNIPIGLERSLFFVNNEYRGIVNIAYDGVTSTIDLYRKEYIEEEIKIPSSSVISYIVANIARSGLFILFIMIILSYPIFALKHYESRKIQRWTKKHWDKMLYTVMGITYVCFARQYSYDAALMGDEVWQLGWTISGEFPQFSFNRYLSTFWFDIMPYGHENLRLMSQLFVAVTIFIAGLLGCELKGKRFGIIMASLVTFSQSVMYQCSLSIRSYSILLFATTLAVYMFVLKQKGNYKCWRLILYSVSLILCLDAHHFGILTYAILGLSDLILLFTKKNKISNVFSWAVTFPYLAYCSYCVVGAAAENANNIVLTTKANFSKLFDFFRWTFSYNDILVVMFVIGYIYIIVNTYFKFKQKKINFFEESTFLTISAIPLIEIFSVYFYSTCVNPENSLLIDRFFITCFICMFFVAGIAIDKTIDYICVIFKSRRSVTPVICAFIVCMCFFNWSQVSPWNPWAQFYRTYDQNVTAVVDYVLSRDDIYSSDTLFIDDHIVDYGDIGITYYTTRKFQRDDINHCAIVEIPDDVEQYKTIYISRLWAGENDRLNQILNEQYMLVEDTTVAKNIGYEYDSYVRVEKYQKINK